MISFTIIYFPKEILDNNINTFDWRDFVELYGASLSQF